MGDEERIPVILATGQAIERDSLVTALDMAERASSAALSTLGSISFSIEQVSVVNILSPGGPAPASALAKRLGLSPTRCEVTTIGGNSPQWLVNRAASAIASGRLGAALIAGGEAMRSLKAGGSRTGAPDSWDGKDPVVGEDRPGVGAAESAIGLMLPAHIYPMFESALAARAGRDFQAQRDRIGALLSPFSEVAAKNAFAWFPTARSAHEIAEPSPSNRLVAEPYTKLMSAFLGSDHGAAVLVTSLAAARRARASSQAVFVWSGADATDVWDPSARPDPAMSPAIAAAGQAALEAGGIAVDDVGIFDLYSCFPSAIELAMEALGIDYTDDRPLTVTGGLAYFGGPGNNYTTHAIASMAGAILNGTGSSQNHLGGGNLGLVSALGWYATKHSIGIYGDKPPPEGFRMGDTRKAQLAIDSSAVNVLPGFDEGTFEQATVVASTVVYNRDGLAQAAPVIARTDSGCHVVARAAPDELAAMPGRNLVGTRLWLSGRPPEYRLAQ
ncbi:MAG: acetyl-CoA acetyltransferase [Actinobacteria bacterium]|nr:acetyl-CoA acetyltransferase [Actinomycetota bacterium]